VSATSAAIVFLAGVASVLAAGLGALPLHFLRGSGASLLGAANGAASGVMASVGVGLVVEGAREGAVMTGLGVVLGAGLILVARTVRVRRLVGSASGSRPTVQAAALVVGVMAAHSLAEGVAVGSSFAAGGSLGLVTAAAIAAHKTAEGFAVGLVLVSRGVRLATAAGWSMATALPQPLIAVPAYAFVETFAAVLPLVLGLAAGAMAAVVLLELLPGACRQARVSTVAVAAGTAFVATSLLQIALTT
jgi:zinc transporter, ZIP family